MATQSRRLLRGALDRIVYSSANYWVTMLSDLAAALAFLALGLNWFSGPFVVAGGVVTEATRESGGRKYHRSITPAAPSDKSNDLRAVITDGDMRNARTSPVGLEDHHGAFQGWRSGAVEIGRADDDRF